ncbi:MAG TPA: ATP-binding cassette domain-containing protein [Gemmataceae bacterium]|nr:ATP-binding cassette domain-containing protein [Gemmataceae bacterium]
MNAVELRKVSKVFAAGVKAVDEISLNVPEGRTVAVLGPSGCGKTTTLRLINRLEEPTTGVVLVRGREVRSQRPEYLRRSIGYVIQEGGLFPHQNVLANVATVPRLLGWDRSRIRGRVSEVLNLVGLPEKQFGKRMPAELSGGQRQRVGVARALAADPDILLMDEPFGALDPGTRDALQDEFVKLNARLRKTVVLVTHDIAEAGRLADDIVLFHHGRVLQQGSLRDLLLQPADDRVRSFLGRRAQWLALEILRLKELLPMRKEEGPKDEGGRMKYEQERISASDSSFILPPSSLLQLSGELPLGQALIKLAATPDDAAVSVDGGVYLAKSLRAHILADLEIAGGSEVRDQKSEVGIRSLTSDF